ncbi:MAG: hypothetical protein OEZ22_12375 [Spirochaetia bacterium]|nr:hypothetical protein [Spirochaetia bacterium]
MKKILVLILTIAVYGSIFGQEQEEQTIAEDENAQVEEILENENKSQSELNGFGGIQWGTKYQDVKDRFQTLSTNREVEDSIEITSDIPNKEIIVKRKGVYYRYLFYKKPSDKEKQAEQMQDFKQESMFPEEKNTQPTENQEAGSGEESEIARLFFVESNFILINAGDLHSKLKQKYGRRTISTLSKDLRGAYVWDLQSGFLVQWIEPYQQKVFSRSLYYISKEIRNEIQKDLKEYQYSKELKVLNSIEP